jgi:hypothetical protein
MPIHLRNMVVGGGIFDGKGYRHAPLVAFVLFFVLEFF